MTIAMGSYANPIDIAALKQTYEKAGQGQVFTFWDKLSEEEQAKFAKQLSEIDVDRVNRIYENAMAAVAVAPPPKPAGSEAPTLKTSDAQPTAPTADALSPLPASSCASAINNAEEEARWRSTGLKAIADGKVAVLLLAGGQGTRLGSANPKGMFDISLPSGRTLFEIQAARIRRLREVVSEATGKPAEQVRIPWYVMTSGPTRTVTEAYFEKKNHFGLPREDVVFFEQGVLPALSNEGKLLLSTASSLSLAPDGNGGVYAALRRPLAEGDSRTVMSDLKDRGVEYIHGYCVDNCLVKVADPVFFGACIERGAACGAKVVRKRDPEELVGVVARKGDGYAVVEYSELPKEMSEQREADGTLSFWAGNIVNHFYTRSFLEEIEGVEARAPFHIAKKKIPTVDLSTGEAIKPSTPNGMKLEMFIFDIFPFTRDLVVLEVDRAEEFSPLKNASGAPSDTPETSRRDLLAQQRRWLEAAGATFADDVEVEVTPDATYAGEGLDFVSGKKFVRSGFIAKPEDVAALI